MTGSIAVVLFAVGMLVSIMIHEWGHFATARRFGMRADRFFVGFGPTLWSTRRGETEYGVKAFPLGGFVSIRGMGDTDARRGPIADDAFDPEALAADRKLAAVASVAAGGTVPPDAASTVTIPATTWQRLEQLLVDRGTPRDVRDRLLQRAQTVISPLATPREARDRFHELVVDEVGEDPSTRSLSWRLRRGDEGRFFADSPPWKRAIVLAAGSTLHMVQAYVLLFLLALFVGGGAIPLPQAGAVVAGSPAEVAGLEVGDVILEVAGTTITEFEQARQIIASRPGETTTFVVERGDDVLTLTGTPQVATDLETGEVVLDPETGEPFGRFGFVPAAQSVGLPATEAAGEALVGEGGLVRITGETIGSLGRVFGPEGIGQVFGSITGEEERDAGGGVSLVGAGQFASDAAAEVGVFITVVGLLASINIFIGIFNILPFPPLDGGHLAVLGVENAVNRVRRARGLPGDFKVQATTVAAIAIPVIAVIGTVSLGLLWLDIVDPVSLMN